MSNPELQKARSSEHYFRRLVRVPSFEERNAVMDRWISTEKTGQRWMGTSDRRRTLALSHRPEEPGKTIRSYGHHVTKVGYVQGAALSCLRNALPGLISRHAESGTKNAAALPWFGAFNNATFFTFDSGLCRRASRITNPPMLYPMRFIGPSTWRSSEESALPRASIETRPLLSYRQIVQGPTSLAMRLRRRSQRLCEPQIPSMINVCVESFRLSGLLSAGDTGKLKTISIVAAHAQRFVRTLIPVAFCC